MKLFEIAMGKPCQCKLCKVLEKYGGTTPEAVREYNLIRERDGYTGKPAHGIEWVKLLADHELYHLRRGESLPLMYTILGLPQEFKDSMVKRQPKVTPQVSKEDLAAIAQFKRVAKGNKRELNGRRDNRPILRPLDTTPFKGF